VEATEVDERLAEAFSAPRHLVPHLHAPLQSGSDRILRRMGRHWYTAGSYGRAVEQLVARSGVFALGADIIAGFPGESEADHQATLTLIRRLPFTYLHVFPYSSRPGTAATRLPGAVPSAVIHERARELRALADELAREYRASRDGGLADVVVVRGDRREGLTGDYLSVVVEGERLPRGTRVDARLRFDAGRLSATSVAATRPS
jgi:threonylcarbamoyladenosine tRNA methylthiotransferase MtaB